MAETVRVSMLHAHGYRASKDDPITRYERGIQTMPLEHARAMGVMHRIVGRVEQGDGGAQVVTRLPFNGVFDEKLSATLTGAGYKTIEDLGRASNDELLSVKGIGPAAFESIQTALGRRAATEGEAE
jgi:hypothetical protein